MVSLVGQRLRKSWDVIAAATYALSAFGSAPRFRFLDIGSRGGLQRKWATIDKLGWLETQIVEPEPEESDRLKQRYPKASCIPFALGDKNGQTELIITQSPGSSSVYEADPVVSESLGIDHLTRAKERITIDLRRYDDCADELNLPTPEFLKLDVQGSELNILKGFGARLDDVLAIELETNVVPVYQKQPLFQDIHFWLRERGFVLQELRGQSLANEELFEFNAFYCRREATLSPQQIKKTRFWQRLLHVASHRDYTLRGG
ncbi:FkbM family methyltransferase [Rhodovibrionaceae bacterium A322]